MKKIIRLAVYLTVMISALMIASPVKADSLKKTVFPGTVSYTFNTQKTYVGPTKIKNQYYLFGENGKKITKAGIYTVKGKKYLVGSSGTLQTGWKKSGSNMLYFVPDKFYCYQNTTVKMDGFSYVFNAKGYVTNYATVGKGKMFTSILKAVKSIVKYNPSTYASTSRKIRAKIVIYEGTYKESLDLDSIKSSNNISISGIYFLGIGDVTITSSKGYPYGAMRSFGSNTFENLNFRETGKGVYAFHYEAMGKTLTKNSRTIFRNCTFTANDNAGVGIGSADHNTYLLFENCTFAGQANSFARGVYLHNSPFNGASNNCIEFRNCTGNGIYIYNVEKLYMDGISKLTVIIDNCRFGKYIFDTGDKVYHKLVKDSSIKVIQKGSVE